MPKSLDNCNHESCQPPISPTPQLKSQMSSVHASLHRWALILPLLTFCFLPHFNTSRSSPYSHSLDPLYISNANYPSRGSQMSFLKKIVCSISFTPQYPPPPPKKLLSLSSQKFPSQNSEVDFSSCSAIVRFWSFPFHSFLNTSFRKLSSKAQYQFISSFVIFSLAHWIK
jgi:hypothetical protein